MNTTAISILLATVATLTDDDLHQSSAAARMSYWTADSAEIRAIFEQLVEAIDTELLNRAAAALA
jgi:hypothetical protein